jgi:hypothetical protein
LGIEAGTGDLNVGTDNTVSNVNLGTGGGTSAKTVVVGNNLGTSTTTLQAGSGGLNEVAAVINIAADATTSAVNIGTGAGVKTVIIGSTNTTSATTITGGTAGSITETAATINIANDATTSTVNLGSGAGAKTTNIGSATTTSTTSIRSGTGAITLSTGVTTPGQVLVTPITATAASPTATVTANSRVIVATFTGFTTAHGVDQTFVINSTSISVTSGILVSIANLDASGNHAAMQIEGIIQAAGVLTIGTINNGLAGGGGNLGAGDNVIITVWVLSL